MSIERYIVVDREDHEFEYEYETLDEAMAHAMRREYAVVARIYEFSDSELIWTPDGGLTWPPTETKTEEEEEA